MVEEVLMTLNSVESVKSLNLKERSSMFYLILDMREIDALSINDIPRLLKTTSRLFDFCKLETENHHLVSVSMVVKNEAVRKLMSKLLSLHKALCPSLICLTLEDGREFASDNVFLIKKRQR